MKWYEVATKGNQEFQMHFLLSSYITDILETDNLLGDKRRNKTFSSCHICYTKKNFLGYTQSLKRNALATVQLVQSLHCNYERSEVQETLRENSMLPVLPMLSSLPFMEIHRSVELYSIFLVEPMHDFYLE